MFIRYALLSFIALLLSACGGSSDSTQESPPPVVVTPAPAPIIYTGIFLDSFVENLSYATASSTGMTNVMGEFSYQLDEQVTFSIGSIAFLPIEAEAIITPLTIFDTQDINNIAVVNMLRLLQSLDIDGNADNGITISDTAHELANGLTVNFSDTDFDSQVANLVAMSGALNQQLISAESAIAHFQQTLSEQDISVCAKTHSKIGQTGFFSTFAHNVAGMATIIDDCTIEITQFDYDGGGPDVYFYAAQNHQYSSENAFAISNKINGQAYQNAAFTLKLPNNKSLDDLTGISVWCVDFNADFGNLEFSP